MTNSRPTFLVLACAAALAGCYTTRYRVAPVPVAHVQADATDGWQALVASPAAAALALTPSTSLRLKTQAGRAILCRADQLATNPSGLRLTSSAGTAEVFAWPTIAALEVAVPRRGMTIALLGRPPQASPTAVFGHADRAKAP